MNDSMRRRTRTLHTMRDAIALRLPDAAAASGLGSSTLREAIREGHLKAGRWGRSVFVMRVDLEQFLRSRVA